MMSMYFSLTASWYDLPDSTVSSPSDERKIYKYYCKGSDAACISLEHVGTLEHYFFWFFFLFYLSAMMQTNVVRACLCLFHVCTSLFCSLCLLPRLNYSDHSPLVESETTRYRQWHQGQRWESGAPASLYPIPHHLNGGHLGEWSVWSPSCIYMESFIPPTIWIRV